MNKPGRSETLLQEHEHYAIDQHLVEYAWGEFYGRQTDPASLNNAMKNFRLALKSNDVPAGAWRELGILEMKTKDFANAKQHLEQYLRLKPEAEDAAIVKFYLSTIEGKHQ